MSRLDGSSQHILLSYLSGKPSSIAVDPSKGLLVWGGSQLESARLDGSNHKILANGTLLIEDVALDYDNEYIYWCDSKDDVIERMRYNGTGREVVLSETLDNPVALTLFDGKLYWVDK